MSFIFGGNTDLTYEQARAMRERAKAMAGRSRRPTTFGGGLTALGEGLASRMMLKNSGKVIGEAEDKAGSVFRDIFGGGASSGDSSYSAPSQPRQSAESALGLSMGQTGNDPRDTVQAGGQTYDMGQKAAPISNYADAIASVESGGRYDAVGPETGKGRALGKYQVMDFNVGPWTEKHLGKRMTPEEFLASPEAQDAVFNGEFGAYVDQYGNPQDAASMWFSGRPMEQAGDASDGYNTVPQYVEKFTAALDGGGREPVRVASNDPSSGLGMIGGVKAGGDVWQSLDGSGMAHASNPQYEDYSQLYREYRFDPPDENWVPVGERNGKTVFAAPDYARDADGNYLPVSAAEAQQLAKQRGAIIPTREEVKGIYSQAERVPMPTSGDFGKPGGQGTSQEYTQAVTRAAQQAGVAPGAPVVHGKEFYAPQQQQQSQGAFPAQRGRLNVGQVPGQQPRQFAQQAPQQRPQQQPQQQPQAAGQMGGGATAQQLMQALSMPGMNQQQRSVLGMLLEQKMQQNDPMRQMQMEKARLELQKLQNPQVEPKIQQLSDGRFYYVDPTGQQPPRPVAEGIEPAPDMTTSQRDYQFYAQQAQEAGEQPLSFNEWRQQDKAAGATNVTVGGYSNPQTAGQEKLDKAFADSYLEWTQGGGADTLSQIAKVEEVADQLGSIASGKSNANLTGPLVGNMPDAIGTMTNPEAVQAREQVEEVVQRNLRLILGAQFTEKEGERLISRAYNPRLPEAENASRLRRLAKAMRAAAQAKSSQVQYFQENGTLTGWQGDQWTVTDFIDAIDGERGPEKPVDNGLTSEDYQNLSDEELLRRLQGGQ